MCSAARVKNTKVRTLWQMVVDSTINHPPSENLYKTTSGNFHAETRELTAAPQVLLPDLDAHEKSGNGKRWGDTSKDSYEDTEKDGKMMWGDESRFYFFQRPPSTLPPARMDPSASAEERAIRRFNQLQDKGFDVSMATLLEEIKKRDHQDRNRLVAPLKAADDALTIDSTSLSIDEVVAEVLAFAEGKL